MARKLFNPKTVSLSMTEDSKDSIIIKPLHGWLPINLREVWLYRDLIYFLVWRGVKIRYKQTFLGAAWAAIQPFSMMVVFTLFFGRLAKIPSEGIPYPLFSYAALLPWMLFTEGIVRSVNCMVQDSNLIKKVYFPRLAMPIASVISPLVDFIIAFVIFIGMMFYFGFTPTIKIIWLPFFLLLALISALAVGLWLSAINVRYRDVRYAIPFLIQIWLFASPVVYPVNLLPKSWHIIYSLNPMAGVIGGFRWALLGTEPPGIVIIGSIIMISVLLIGGAFYFRRMEKIFADVV